MTLYELSECIRLLKIREKQAEVLDMLTQSSMRGLSQSSEKVQTSGISDKTGRMASEIADLQREIEALDKQFCSAWDKIETQIKTIDDVCTRTLFRLRFLHCLTWSQIAGTMHYMSEDAVKKICYRYLQEHAEK